MFSQPFGGSGFMATKATRAAVTDYDAIIVGGGHNGLVAAAYLARSGARTLVLEARPKTGGAATTEAPWPDAPDFRVSRLSYVMSLLPPTIIKDLQLAKHGYKIFPMGPYYQAYASSATHAGGGVCGIPGMQAARAAIADRHAARRGPAQTVRRPGS